jgi:nucleotide-binding universal stress UspA family protein
MSVAVGYLAGKGGRSPLYLAVEAAKTLKTSLIVVTVVPRPWMTPSIARIDAEYAQYADQLAADSAKEAQQCLDSIGDGVKVDFRKVAHRSASSGLLEAVAGLNPEVLVLGSAADGQLGQVIVGSTADRLLHSSPVPLAISPRGYRGSKAGGLTRLTCAYPGTPECVNVVERVAALAERLGVPMRVITFAVRGRTMYPPQVGLRAEDSILEAWAAQARETLTELRTKGVVGDEVELRVAAGNGWDQAIDAADWRDGELLALGTKPAGGITRVFLGSRGSKILRHSPVPVLVLPG